MKRFLPICFYFITSSLFAQTPQQIEADLLKSFKQIDYWKEHYRDNDYKGLDSLSKSNKVFGEKLKSYTMKYPFTIDQKFPLLAERGLKMVTGSDGLFRIYSWDTQMGGTQYDIDNVFQYKFNNSTNSIFKIDTDYKSDNLVCYFSKLYTFKVSNNTYYLAVYNTNFSTSDWGEGIQVFGIENGKLNENVKLIKTKTGLHSQLYYNYDFAPLAYVKVRPGIYFDANTKTIHVPVVIEKGKVTHRYITYKFTGQYFERVKN